MVVPADPPDSELSGAPQSAFASLRLPEYRRLWTAGLLTFGAVPMQSIARGFLAFDLTGRNSALGVVLFGMGLPMIVLAPIGGVVADRFDKRLVLLIATMMLWAPAALISILLLADQLDFWMLVVASVFQGAAFSLMGPVRMAMTAELVGRDLLANAVVLAQLSSNSTRVLGPSIAGAMLGIAFFGVTGVYLAVTALFTIGILLVIALPKSVPNTGESAGSPWADLVEGLRYVRSDPPVLWPTLMSMAVLGVAFPYVAFLPSLVEDVFEVGPAWLGWLSAIGAVGAVASSFLIARRSGRRITDMSVTVVAIVFGLMVIGLGLSPNVWWALAISLFAGAANAGFQALNNSLVLLRAEERYHGRVQSLLMLGFSAFGIFALPLGAIADAIGLQQTMVAMGVVSITLVTAIQLKIRQGSERANAASSDE